MLCVAEQYFVNRECLETPHYSAALALSELLTFEGDVLGNALEDPSFLAKLTVFINSGYWYFMD